MFFGSQFFKGFVLLFSNKGLDALGVFPARVLSIKRYYVNKVGDTSHF